MAEKEPRQDGGNAGSGSGRKPDAGGDGREKQGHAGGGDGRTGDEGKSGHAKGVTDAPGETGTETETKRGGPGGDGPKKDAPDGGQKGIATGDPAGPKRKYDTGASMDAERKGQDGDGKKKKSLLARAKEAAIKASMAMHAAVTAAKAAIALKIMMLMQMMMQMFAAAAAALMQTALGMVLTAIANAIVTVVTTVATAIGTTVATAAAVVATAATVLVTVAVVLVSALLGTENEQTRDGIPECVVNTGYMEPDATVDQTKMNNAKTIASFLKALDYSDAQIAAVIGYMDAANGIDPTYVYGCSMKYGLDVKKQWLEQGQVTVTWQRGGPPLFSHVSTTFQLGGNVIWLWDRIDNGPEADPRYTWIPAERTVSSGHRSFSVPAGTRIVGFMLKYVAPFSTVGNYGADRTHYADYVFDYDKGYSEARIPIGVGVWGGAQCKALLDYASGHNRRWYDLETQLLFMFAGDRPYKRTWLLNWVDNNHQLYTDDEYGARAACDMFMMLWGQYSADDPESWQVSYGGLTGIEASRKAAADWYKIIHQWRAGIDYNSAAGQSLLDIVKAETGRRLDAIQSTSLRSCSGARFQDSQNAAAAIVSYAWGPGQPYENDGTKCWQHIHNVTATGDPWTRACDRTVACAIRWSGTDTNYPLGACEQQLNYLVASDAAYRAALYYSHSKPEYALSDNQAYWTEVTPTWTGNASAYVAQLMPGDVLIRSDASVGHTLMFVGNELIRRRWPDAPAYLCCVSGSIPFTGCSGYSPHVGGFSVSGTGSGAYQTYRVFRCVKTYSNNPAWTQATCVDFDNDT